MSASYANGSLYTGTTRAALDVWIAQHNDGYFDGGYTAVRRPVTLIYAQWFDHITDAIAGERRLKGWSRAKKEALAEGKLERLQELSRRRGPHPSRRVQAAAPQDEE
ncbi:GIY-YIG nuclease family protein [Bradyrhizobium sp. U87765 SZCCT0131]|nr:GIY-YIG nuclease family protein [Bradyrhizobium sp. U87765 SZCCT0131]MBR1261731.1 GIY-YIG nuclease family protein [Bradyrhizobium sp. U87765 SZCCT0134]MBR1306416.1 GIY-YIG nuclease family protein [Bradyrhizobium sp. U87765 SZCCT0110]MBR1317513.1 GIY-YIG nuclease family protein [Bradyrhizobium sp. U87765 SZCCT0109]MBR1351215.1 GIY-YIG nuclease family protein [Bradyrhizobium sp. U87765 SZCCT0048]